MAFAIAHVEAEGSYARLTDSLLKVGVKVSGQDGVSFDRAHIGQWHGDSHRGLEKTRRAVVYPTGHTAAVSLVPVWRLACALGHAFASRRPLAAQDPGVVPAHTLHAEVRVPHHLDKPLRKDAATAPSNPATGIFFRCQRHLVCTLARCARSHRTSFCNRNRRARGLARRNAQADD